MHVKPVRVAAGFAVIAVAAIAVAGGVPWARSASVDPTASPVLVELFTSEACSKCPPADSVLFDLATAQPVENAHVIAIAAHVNSESRTEWRDPFASPRWEERQRKYADAMSRVQTYTPQAVIDGTIELPGQNTPRVRNAIARAADQAKPFNVQVTVPAEAGNAASESLQVRVVVKPGAAARGSSGTAAAEVLLAVTEDDLTSRVTAGENAGRTLHHSVVLRSLTSLGSLDGPSTPKSIFDKTTHVPLAVGWMRSKLRIVAFVQESETMRVIGVGTAQVR